MNSFNNADSICGDVEGFIACLTDKPVTEIFLTAQPIYHARPPLLEIKINGNLLFSDAIVKDNQPLHFTIENTEKIELTVGMRGKTKFDTKVDSNGNIVADHAIKLLTFTIDGFDLLSDHDFCAQHSTYINLDHRTEEAFKPGFWHNADWCIQFDTPWVSHYNSRSNSNVQVAPSLEFKDWKDKEKTWTEVYASITKLSV